MSCPYSQIHRKYFLSCCISIMVMFIAILPIPAIVQATTHPSPGTELNIGGMWDRTIYDLLHHGANVYAGRVSELKPNSVDGGKIERGVLIFRVEEALLGPDAKTLTLPYVRFAEIVKADFSPVWPDAVLKHPDVTACTIVIPNGIDAVVSDHLVGDGAAVRVYSADDYKGTMIESMKAIISLDSSFGDDKIAEDRLKKLVQAAGDSSLVVRQYADAALVNEYLTNKPEVVAQAILNQLDAAGNTPDAFRDEGSSVVRLLDGQSLRPKPQPWIYQSLGLLARIGSANPSTLLSRKALFALARQVADEKVDITFEGTIASFGGGLTMHPAATQPVSGILTPDQQKALRSSLDAMESREGGPQIANIVRHWLDTAGR